MDHAEILIRARHELDLNGWCKGSFGTNDGPKCAIGALRYAVGGQASRPPNGAERYGTYVRVREVLEQVACTDLDERHDYFQNIPNKNDLPRTTSQEVKDWFLEALEAVQKVAK